MGTLSALVDLARSALQVDQQALNATSNNVANQNTPGYTREVVNFETGQDSVTLSNGLQTATAPTAETTSVRDRVLEQRVDQATQIQASTAAQSAVLSQVEDVFGLSGSTATAGSTELGTSLNALFSSFTALSASPSNAATREAVLQRGFGVLKQCERGRDPALRDLIELEWRNHDFACGGQRPDRVDRAAQHPDRRVEPEWGRRNARRSTTECYLPALAIHRPEPGHNGAKRNYA